ncbi:MAG: EcsC family protein [Bacteroidota bacterium]
MPETQTNGAAPPAQAGAGPSPYEQAVIREIKNWKTPSDSVLAKAARWGSTFFFRSTRLFYKIPGVQGLIETGMGALLKRTAKATQRTIDDEKFRLLDGYQAAGLDVNSLGEIATLDLQAVESQAKGIRAKYGALASVEGAATGYVGLAGIVPDVLALTALGLRTASEYALHYGYDPTTDDEYLHLLEVLDYASNIVAPSDEKPYDCDASPTVQLSAQAREQVLKAGVREAAKSIAGRLVRNKIGQFVPVTGAAVGSGLNLLFITRVSTAARMCYAERFLERKYGVEIETL